MRIAQFIGLPLGDVKLVFCEVGVGHHFEAHVIETLKGSHAGSAYGNGLTVVVEEFGDGLTSHADVFGVHLMTFHLLALDRLERTSTHMESEFLAINTVGIESSQHLRREVQTSRWGSHTTLDL